MLAFFLELLFYFIVDIVLCYSGAALRTGINWISCGGKKSFRQLFLAGSAGWDVCIGALALCLVCAVLMLVT